MIAASYIRNCGVALLLCVGLPVVAEITVNGGAHAADIGVAHPGVTAAPAATRQNVVLPPPVAVGESASSNNANEPDHALEMSRLRARGLTIPLQNVAASQLIDTYLQPRSGSVAHEALDIMAPRGTPVIAVGDGPVAKLFLSKPGGLTLYQFDPQGEYSYYYAHLDSYAQGLKEGDMVRKGQIIAYVGSTGNASPDAPHLHFAVFRLGPARQWWRGTPINPFLIWRNSPP